MKTTIHLVLIDLVVVSINANNRLNALTLPYGGLLKLKIMRCKLLKKLRRKGRSKVTIHSVTRTKGCITGIGIGYYEDEYSSLFDFGDTEEDVKKKAERIYIEAYLKNNRNRHLH